MPCRKNCTRKVTFHETVDTIVNEKKCRLVWPDVHQDSLRELSVRYPDFRARRFRFAASERKANTVRLNRAVLSIDPLLVEHS